MSVAFDLFVTSCEVIVVEFWYEMDVTILAGVYVFVIRSGHKRKLIHRRIWSQPWFLERNAFGHANLLDEYRICPRTFREYMKMSEASYVHLLSLVSDSIEKQETIMRPSISAHDRLSATLRYLATGEKLADLQARCNISRAALSSILPNTLRAIVVALQEEVRLPQCQQEWKEVANKFRSEVMTNIIQRCITNFLSKSPASTPVWVRSMVNMSVLRSLQIQGPYSIAIKAFFPFTYLQSWTRITNSCIATLVLMDPKPMQVFLGRANFIAKWCRGTSIFLPTKS